MNKHDEIIFDLLGDLRAILDRVDDSMGLKIIRDKALIAFQTKKYSDINVIDTRNGEGNTFLHYAMHESDFFWYDMILKAGANPLIENKKGRNCFRVFRKYNDTSDFFKKYRYIRLDKDFNKNAAGFSQEFKQVLFEQRYKDFIGGENIAEIESYLKSIHLDSINNRLLIIGNNKILSLDNKLKYYLENFEGEENNSFFLRQLCQSLGKVVFKNKEAELLFFERNFANNKNFKESVSSLSLFIKTNKDYLESPLPQMIKLILSQDFDLTTTTDAREQTLEEYLISQPLISECFLSEKLNKQLKEDTNKKFKAIKL